MSSELHVIFGTGPVGCWTARALSRQGRAVRAVNRSGVRPALLPADAALASARAADARYVSIENLYRQGASRPIDESSPLVPGKRKGALRLALAAGVSEAHACGGLRSTAFRSSDYLGPGTREEALGDAWIAPPGPA